MISNSIRLELNLIESEIEKVLVDLVAEYQIKILQLGPLANYATLEREI